MCHSLYTKLPAIRTRKPEPHFEGDFKHQCYQESSRCHLCVIICVVYSLHKSSGKRHLSLTWRKPLQESWVAVPGDVSTVSSVVSRPFIGSWQVLSIKVRQGSLIFPGWLWSYMQCRYCIVLGGTYFWSVESGAVLLLCLGTDWELCFAKSSVGALLQSPLLCTHTCQRWQHDVTSVMRWIRSGVRGIEVAFPLQLVYGMCWWIQFFYTGLVMTLCMIFPAFLGFCN